MSIFVNSSETRMSQLQTNWCWYCIVQSWAFLDLSSIYHVQIWKRVLVISSNVFFDLVEAWFSCIWLKINHKSMFWLITTQQRNECIQFIRNHIILCHHRLRNNPICDLSKETKNLQIQSSNNLQKNINGSLQSSMQTFEEIVRGF